MAKTLTITRITPQDGFMLETQDTVLVLDPGYMGAYTHQGIPESKLKAADLILITHAHADHMQPELIDRLSKATTIIVAPEVCREKLDRPFQPIAIGETLSFQNIEVTAVPAYNTPSGRSNPKNHHRDNSLGYRFRLAGKTFYFAGDTDVIPEMGQLGPIDVAFLPISGTYVMDAEEALEAATVIRPGVSIAMHQMSSDPEHFLKPMAERGQKAVFLNVSEALVLKI